jgi:Ribbon-helix-helix protein, copG family
MKNTPRQRKPVLAEGVARLAEQGRDVSHFFTNRSRMMHPIQRVNVDFTAPMLEELDKRAEELNISRQAVIKMLIRQALDQHYLANAATAARGMMKAR